MHDYETSRHSGDTKTDATQLLFDAIHGDTHGDRKTGMRHAASEEDREETIKTLKEAGATLGGGTATHDDVLSKKVQLLLGEGADPRIANKEGQTPADLAREKGYSMVAAILDARGEEMNRAEKPGTRSTSVQNAGGSHDGRVNKHTPETSLPGF